MLLGPSAFGLEFSYMCTCAWSWHGEYQEGRGQITVVLHLAGVLDDT